MDYMDLAVCCPRKADKLNHSLIPQYFSLMWVSKECPISYLISGLTDGDSSHDLALDILPTNGDRCDVLITSAYMKCRTGITSTHDDVIKWKHFPRYRPFVRGIHRSPVNYPHKGQWRGALMFSLICVWITGWVNNREVGDLRRYRAHYDGSVMVKG